MTLDEALEWLLGSTEHGEDFAATLIAAAKETWRRRHLNTEAGAVVLAALNDPAITGLTYREIERLTGIPRPTAQRWATTPESDATRGPDPS